MHKNKNKNKSILEQKLKFDDNNILEIIRLQKPTL